MISPARLVTRAAQAGPVAGSSWTPTAGTSGGALTQIAVRAGYGAVKCFWYPSFTAA